MNRSVTDYIVTYVTNDHDSINVSIVIKGIF